MSTDPTAKREDALREDREERAAILEFDAGMSREEAERAADEMTRNIDERELGESGA